MNDWHDEPDRAAIEHITKPLRRPLRLDDTFEVRVMSAVHAEALARFDAAHAQQQAAEEANGAWWRRTYNLPVSLGGMAIAASIVGFVLIGATVFARMNAPSGLAVPVATSVSPPEDVQNVQFVLADPSAQQVWLVGDFNGWTKTQTPLVRASNASAWTVSVPLPSGRHEYAFIVHDGKGERWLADPSRTAVRDEFGTESSVLHVGATEGIAQANGS
jgi:hypothetical protein